VVANKKAAFNSEGGAALLQSQKGNFLFSAWKNMLYNRRNRLSWERLVHPFRKGVVFMTTYEALTFAITFATLMVLVVKKK
jgi:hypothetical protein